MKKKVSLLLFAFASIAITSLNAQIRNIPSKVTDSFKAKYPDAQKVEWKDKITYFEAEFTLDGNEATADFSSKGEWQETDKKISFEALPASVKDGFKKSKYNDWTPGSVTQIDKKGKDVKYKIFVEKSSLVQKKFLTFNEKGELEREDQSI